MISLFLKTYRKIQMKNLYKEWHANAVIGEMFELGGLNSYISNESGNKLHIRIGDYCRIHGNMICKASGKVEMGNYCVLQDGASIQCLEHIKIGHYVGIANNTTIVDNNHHRIEPEERIKHRLRCAPGGDGYPGLGNGWEISDSAPVIIEDVVWIGAQCSILKGVTVGEGSVVAKNSVVTKDVPPYTIVAGNPAKVVKKLTKPDYKYYEVQV